MGLVQVPSGMIVNTEHIVSAKWCVMSVTGAPVVRELKVPTCIDPLQAFPEHGVDAWPLWRYLCDISDVAT